MDHKGLTADPSRIPGFVCRGHALGNRGRFVSVAPFLHLCLPVDICAAQLGRRGVVEAEIVGNAEGVDPIGDLVEADQRLAGGGGGIRLGTAQPMNAARRARLHRLVVGRRDLQRRQQPGQNNPKLPQFAKARMCFLSLRTVDDRPVGVEGILQQVQGVERLAASASSCRLCGSNSTSATASVHAQCRRLSGQPPAAVANTRQSSSKLLAEKISVVVEKGRRV